MTDEIVELEVTALAAGGDAVGRDAAGRVTFVPGAAPGERVRARIVEAHRSFARAELVDVVAASPDRVAPPCPYAATRTCGGCPWMHVAPGAQRAAKQALAEGALRHLIARGLVLAPIATPAPLLGWRRRARFHWARARGAPAARIGLHPPRARDVTDLVACPQLDPALDAAFGAARALAPALDGAGELHLALGEGGVVHVVIEPGRGGRVDDAAAAALVGRAGIAGVVVVTRAGRRAHGAPRIAIEPGLSGAADDFAQASAAGNAALVAAAAAAVAPRPGLRVLELHAGSGNFTRALVGAGAEVVANDRHAPRAFPAGARFEAGPAAAVIARLAASGARFDAALLDPPRTGDRDAAAALAALGAAGPARIVYVSCDPATCARDLAVLADAGWAPRRAQVLDLMPQTAHVELVAVVER